MPTNRSTPDDSKVKAFSVALGQAQIDSLAVLFDDDMAIDEAGGQIVLEIDECGVLTANGYLLDRDGEWVTPNA